MNVYTVRDNLLNTIRGKEELLAQYKQAHILAKGTEDIVTYSVMRFLELNLEELYGILNDVQVCCKQASDDSWATNPDRMGGQFTDEEIRRSGEWR